MYHVYDHTRTDIVCFLLQSVRLYFSNFFFPFHSLQPTLRVRGQKHLDETTKKSHENKTKRKKKKLARCLTEHKESIHSYTYSAQ